MQQIWQLWKDAANDPISRAVVTVFVLVLLILIAVYVVGWFRNLAVGKEEPVNAFDDLEALRSKGKISLEEYQRLKKTVNQNLAAELTKPNAMKKDLLKNSEGKGRSNSPINPHELPQQSDSGEPDFRPADEG